METTGNLSIPILPMTRPEYLGVVRPLDISYSILSVPLGDFLVASTTKGVCFLMPAEGECDAVETLRMRFPHARLRCQEMASHKQASLLLQGRAEQVHHFRLHLYGTPFELAVWGALLEIPAGRVTTYADVTRRIGRPKAARAVGTAVGKNPIVYIIPCHRVICKNGTIGGFHWGIDMKTRFLNQESDGADNICGTTIWTPTFF